jgi:DNA modification methylase
VVRLEEVTREDYQKFAAGHKFVTIEDAKIPIGEAKPISTFEPEEFELECTTVWSFPKRGAWATHKGDYRGNWAPEIPRNIILRYSQPDDTVLDPMVGSGTTLIECKLLGRLGIGVDINKDAVMITRDRLEFKTPNGSKTYEPKTYVGDAKNLTGIADETVDLIAMHPPYANIISYSKNGIAGDLSSVRNIDNFIGEMTKVAAESYRVLKEGKYCCVLIGDTRREKHYVPVASRVMRAFCAAGFVLKENIIKRQWQCKATGFWANKSKDNNFLLIMHENLFVFRKPEEGERAKLVESTEI